MEILLVDDNIERIRSISSKLPDYCVSEYVTSKKEALERLSKKFYDLVIVDLIIPEDIKKEPPSAEHGRSLIETILSVKKISMPFQIVGMTIERETYQANIDFFNNRLIPFVLCDNENEWYNRLLSLIAGVRKVADVFNQKIDVAIVTAVEDEYKEVLNLPIKWTDYQSKQNLAIYKIGQVTYNEHTLSVVLLKLNEMGLVAASMQTAALLNEFHPKLVCMCGICAGIKGEVEKGDLIVAEKTWDYGNGKVLPQEHGGYYYDFDAEPNQIGMDATLVNVLRIKGAGYLKLACDEWKTKTKKDCKSNFKIGALPSGAAVVQDEKLIKSIVIPQHRKCLGIDMETYAVYYACHSNKMKPQFVSMKAVVDFADKSKDDKYHKFCSFISAKTLYNFILESHENGIL